MLAHACLPASAVFVLLAACSAPRAPAAGATSAPPRAAATATPSPNPAAVALGVVVVRIDESPLPPPGPTAETPARRETPTPYATVEPAWKYISIEFAVENHSDSPRLVSIAGADPTATNLASAMLAAGDGKRYKAFASYSSLGQRTANNSQTSYPVLLRLPAGFRALAESFGTQSILAPSHNRLTFKVPATLTDYGTLTIPQLTSLGPKTGDDDVSSRLRPLLGGFQPLDMRAAGSQSVAFPSDAPPAQVQPIGASVTTPGKVTVTLTAVDGTNPADYQSANRGWKQVSLSLRYRNDDAAHARAFNVSAWLFGQDGVVYTGDVPAIGNFGRALTPPEPSALLVWDGRSAGTDEIPAGETQDGRRVVFQVPREMQDAVLVLGGDVEAIYNVTGIPIPPRN
jgi:hypothetical protein